MAKKLDTFPFRHQQYPWDEWFDGSIWQLTKDEDFGVTADTMRTTIMGQARRRGIDVRTRGSKDGKTVTFQAILAPTQPDPDDEREN